jgi:FkbM family methyltransferase
VHTLASTHWRVLAIEAAPETYRKLRHNLSLNQTRSVTALNLGVADRHATLRMALNTNGNRAANSFLFTSSETIEVPCQPLYTILLEQGIAQIAGAKLDIEGFEYRTLRQFFSDATPALWPRFIIIERNPAWVSAAGGDSIALLQTQGYRIHATHDDNFIMVRAR